VFDDSLLDDPHTLDVRGQRLHHLAGTGARLRWDVSEEMATIAQKLGGVLPRAVLVMGTEARLVRAIVETGSPVPCVAWQQETLPAWTGALDMVVILPSTKDWHIAGREAMKRGAMVFVVASQSSLSVSEVSDFVSLPLVEDDPFVAALYACKILDLLGVGTNLDLLGVADTIDEVCDRCGPRHSLESNPAKNLACALADTIPLVWGESVLAARASRRVAEALREATGVPALAAGKLALLPLIETAPRRDVFADPFEEDTSSHDFCLLVLDDQEESPLSELQEIAEFHHIRVDILRCVETHPVARYAGLLYQGLYAAAYLGLATVKE